MVSVAPINGSGSPQTFSATYASAAGASDLNSVYLIFNGSLSEASGCVMYYVRASNTMYLVNQAGNGVVAGSITPGTAGTPLTNSQCTIANAGAVTTSGNNLTIPLNITFASGFGGTKQVYGYAINNANQVSGSISLGTWIGH